MVFSFGFLRCPSEVHISPLHVTHRRPKELASSNSAMMLDAGDALIVGSVEEEELR